MKLSKSKFMAGVQCLKRLYLLVHEPELAGDPSPADQAILEQGQEVGLLARELFRGPHFHALTDEITAVARTRRLRLAVEEPDAGATLQRCLVAHEAPTEPRFLAVKTAAPAPANDGTLALPADARRALRLVPGDELAFLPF